MKLICSRCGGIEIKPKEVVHHNVKHMIEDLDQTGVHHSSDNLNNSKKEEYL